MNLENKLNFFDGRVDAFRQFARGVFLATPQGSALGSDRQIPQTLNLVFRQLRYFHLRSQ